MNETLFRSISPYSRHRHKITLSQVAQQKQPAEIADFLNAKNNEILGVKADLLGQEKIIEVSCFFYHMSCQHVNILGFCKCIAVFCRYQT